MQALTDASNISSNNAAQKIGNEAKNWALSDQHQEVFKEI